MTGTGFETEDQSGSTEHINNSVSTTSQKVPAVADKTISEILIENLSSSDANLLVSFNNGSGWKAIKPGGHLIWTPKGYGLQFDVKAESGTVNYESIINFEDY